MMTNNEALDALAGVQRTEQRLADRARWSFGRHAMFGLSEGLIIGGIAQPSSVGMVMNAAGFALMIACIVDDRKRHGMFVSGWQPRATRPLMVMLVAVLLPMLLVALWLRDGTNLQPLGFALGALVFVVCTAASLRWETIYRRALGEEGQQ